MSNSAKERDNPPPRRKSCTPCIKAKRRCEYPSGTTPAAATACLRCARRGVVVCDYPTHHQRRQRMVTMTATPPQSVTSLAEEDCAGVQVQDLDGYLRMAPPLDMDIGPLMADLDYAAMGDGLECLPPGPYDVRVPDQVTITDDYDDMPALALYEPGTTVMAPVAQELEYVSSAIQSRLEFAVDLMRNAPRTMGSMPAAMQDALGCCALYLAKTAANAPVVFSLLDTRVSALVAGAAVAPPDTLRAALAHTHALLLYQIMQLFDGDVCARARGERLIPALDAATWHLLSFVRFDCEPLLRAAVAGDDEEQETDGRLRLYPVRRVRDKWHDWALHESARRTVLITFYMLQAYRAMTVAGGGSVAGAAPPRCTALRHAWTLSMGLWRVQSAVGWARTWNEGRWWVVTNNKQRWERTLEEARPDDVDPFARMWMTALMGVEEAEGWFASKGGALRERDVQGELAMVR